ncbi:phage tail protein [Rhodoferax aquaticus]|uniref:Tip attachment protein J domain-containing protein n=1 Tax=Rhodoferax aquaticus TaxID=2527691 RepID=A0A515ERJ6_9BURK|nr:phage tail protein [Rhodoferax aquaticus]QDL55296.1 hypothetical protein EXZ61_14595 [Rhodoferax aquaticus]
MPKAVEKAVNEVSNLVKEAVPVIGAVVGFIYGGPQGAAMGYSLGKMASNANKGNGHNTPSFVAAVQERDQVVRSSVANRTVIYGRAMVSGPLVFAGVAGGGNKYLWMVVPLAGHEVDAIETIYLNELEVALDGSGYATTAPYAGKVLVKKHLGVAGDAADADLVAVNIGWTSNHRLAGVAYLAIRLEWSADVFPTGIPNIKAVVRGRKVYDPRTGTTVWSQNPALCVRDYITSAHGLEASSAEVDASRVVAVANVCDESVALAGGGTEARYTCNGVIDTGENPRSVMESLLSSMAGFVVWSGGQYQMHCGAYTAPSVLLTADDLRGAVKVRPRMSRKELFNAVRGTFVDPAAFWQPTDFPIVRNATYAAQDGGQVIWRDAVLPFTTSSATAQRIAKLTLERSRQGITVELACKLTAFKVATMDTVMLSLAQLGWVAKEFKVLEWHYSTEGGVDLVLQEETAASYNWNSGMQTVVDAAPDTNLGNPFTIATPGAPAVAESLYQTTGSAGVKSRATVTWAAVDDAFVTGYLLEYMVVASGAWTTLPILRDTKVELNDLTPGTYLFRLRAINTFQAKSAYSPTTSKELLGLTAPPANVANFSVSKVGGVAVGAWGLAGDLDVRIGGRIVVRHSPQTSAATWQDGVVLDEFAGDSVSGLLPLITGTYMAKAKDSTGTFSTGVSSFVAEEGLVTGFNTVATSVQAPVFAGAKTGTVAFAGGLQLDTALLFDAAPGSFDGAAGLFDSFGGLNSIGSYEFATYTDLSTVTTRRLEADIKVYSFDSQTLFDARAGLFDDNSGDFDGTAVNDCDATLYYAATNDNPAGTPVWGAWTPFFVADVTARALKFRLDLESGNAAQNISVSTLSVDIKTPV